MARERRRLDDPAAELRKFLADGCSDVGDVAARRRAIAAGGYHLLGGFVLSPVGWWENCSNAFGYAFFVMRPAGVL